MGRLIYTENSEFDFSDWEEQSIEKVFAGTGCVMAVTEDGRTLQKITLSKFAARTEYWTRIKEIALSEWYEGLAIGLVSDGTCLVSKRPLRDFVEVERSYRREIPFERVNDEVRSWHDIVQVAVSDAFFALDSHGCVHYAAVSRSSQEEYFSVTRWRNVRRIVTGIQNSILGITADGRILRAGGSHSAHTWLDSVTDAVDAFITSAEAQTIYIVKKDGSVYEHSFGRVGEAMRLSVPGERSIIKGNYYYNVCWLDPENELMLYKYQAPEPVFKEHEKIKSFAVSGFVDPVIIAVTE